MKRLVLSFVLLFVGFGAFAMGSSSRGYGAPPSDSWFLPFFLPFIGTIAIVYFFVILPRQKKIKLEQETKRLQNEISLGDLLKQNELEMYFDVFQKNKIENITMAVELTDNDLENMGISVLGDKKKILTLFAEKKLALEEDGNNYIQVLKSSATNVLITGVIALICCFIPILKIIAGIFVLVDIFLIIISIKRLNYMLKQMNPMAKKIFDSRTKELDPYNIMGGIGGALVGIAFIISIINFIKFMAIAVVAGGILQLIGQ
jgi:hypothetical protein